MSGPMQWVTLARYDASLPPHETESRLRGEANRSPVSIGRSLPPYNHPDVKVVPVMFGYLAALICVSGTLGES